MGKGPIFDKPNVVVTGGAGFLGSHLCDALVQKNKVICIDNFSTGREENVDHLLQRPDFIFLRHDITEPLDLNAVPELDQFQVPFQGVQEIYHLACPTSPKDYERLPLETLYANAFGTKQALDMALKYKSTFFLASTAAIYGEPLDEKIFVEDYWGYVNPLGPRSPYDEGKRYAETLSWAYRRAHNLDVKILRMFKTYGPRMKIDDGRMIPDWVNAALNNQPLEIYGDEKMSGTFCYVSDMVEVILKMMQSSESGPLNVGQTLEYTFKEIAEKIKKFAQSRSEIRSVDRPDVIQYNGVPDISRAKDVLGWFPVTDIDKGLQLTVEELRGQKVITYK